MENPRRRRKKKSPGMGRGIVALGLAAAALAGASWLVTSRIPDVLSEIPETRTAPTEPQSPIPANPYGPEDFTYEDGYLVCTSGSYALGVDVSSHQGEVDWARVADSGMEFAMIRIGYRGYTSGGIYEDEWAAANLTGAKDAGLKVGAYFYSQATNATEAAMEAAYCIEFLEGYDIDMPVVFDWEYVSQEARTGAMDARTLMDCTITFCEAIREAGYEPMVYFNPTLGDSLLDLENLMDYPWWLAMYSDEMTYPHAIDMWQYTANGNVPGIAGDTDINIWLSD